MSHRTVRSVVIGALLFLYVPALRGADFAWVPKRATGNYNIVGQEIILTGAGQQVTLHLEMSGWDPEQDDDPLLGAFQATVNSTGYTNGIGTPLTPLGWPGSAELGAFQALNLCTINFQPDPNGAPCLKQADCPGEACVSNFDFVFNGLNPLAALSLASLDYNFAALAQLGGRADDGTNWYGGTLILEVPVGADGTYTVGFSADQNFTFMTDFSAGAITPINLIPVLITVLFQCEVDADCNDGNACTDDSCVP
ncbi:MAG: hypothetical protein IH987_10820, partial [Planctomycetes bacterium]|nr:hypothetical protein [Planctomycetota bacterium]